MAAAAEAPVAAAAQPVEPQPVDGFRPDIEGLRGLAILLVLVFHAGVPGTGGGFIGVDVFFVISGFLITGLLLRERESTGRIDLVAFYARRARRILPAAIATLLGTLAVSWMVLAPLDLRRITADAASVALFGGNVRFALGASDYFAASGAPSPFLQYWSLGVEEQFYLVWPALFIVTFRALRMRASAVLSIAAVLAVSYAAALYVTDASAQLAFYLLPTRAWQFAAGALLAATVDAQARMPALVRSIAGWIGLVAIGGSVVAIGTDTPYPGVAALLPTCGAVALLLAGDAPRAPGAVLAVPPMRALGRISYSLYLVHWPILTLPAAGLAIGAELHPAQRIALVFASIAVAWASHRWIEEPFRHGRFVLPPRRVLATAGATVMAMLVVITSVDLHAARLIDGIDDASPATDSVAAAAVAAGGAEPSGDATAGEDGAVADDTPPPDLVADITNGFMADAADAPVALATRPSATASATPAPVRFPTRLPAHLQPALAAARNDQDGLLHDGCELGYAGTTPPTCIYGDRNGTVTVALVGDSHASQWFPALEVIAKQRHWRLVPLVKLSCRFFDMPMLSRVLKRQYTECEAWRSRVVVRLQSLRPDLVIVAVARGPDVLSAADNDPRVQGEAVARLLDRIPGRAAILVDTPQSYYDVPACVSANPRNLRRCETPRRAAFGWRWRILERTAAKASGAAVVDLSSATCPADPCPVVIGNRLVYRDSHHLTATFAVSLAPTLSAALPRP